MTAAVITGASAGLGAEFKMCIRDRQGNAPRPQQNGQRPAQPQGGQNQPRPQQTAAQPAAKQPQPERKREMCIRDRHMIG